MNNMENKIDHSIDRVPRHMSITPIPGRCHERYEQKSDERTITEDVALQQPIIQHLKIFNNSKNETEEHRKKQQQQNHLQKYGCNCECCCNRCTCEYESCGRCRCDCCNDCSCCDD